ncbi:MAG: class C sortase [Clostridia bacterium]
MKKHLPTILIILVFVVGLVIMIYPKFSDWYNSTMNSYVVSGYADIVSDTNEEEFAQILQDAKDYNQELHSLPKQFVTGEAQAEDYIESLDVYNGMMGYIVIDKIGVELPIYHGTDEDVLQTGVGHLEGSSLPTGEIGNNTVLTGHTGLPSASLFTNLTQMEIGDTFELYILDEVYTYEVFNIVVVEPYEVDNLEAIDGKDVVTLVTCTPYGVNSHRLLVQGEQIEVTEEVVLETSTNIDENESKYSLMPIVIIISAVIIAILVIIIVVWVKKKKKEYRFNN